MSKKKYIKKLEKKVEKLEAEVKTSYKKALSTPLHQLISDQDVDSVISKIADHDPNLKNELVNLLFWYRLVHFDMTLFEESEYEESEDEESKYEESKFGKREKVWFVDSDDWVPAIILQLRLKEMPFDQQEHYYEIQFEDGDEIVAENDLRKIDEHPYLVTGIDIEELSDYSEKQFHEMMKTVIKTYFDFDLRLLDIKDENLSEEHLVIKRNLEKFQEIALEVFKKE